MSFTLKIRRRSIFPRNVYSTKCPLYEFSPTKCPSTKFPIRIYDSEMITYYTVDVGYKNPRSIYRIICILFH